MTTPIVPLTQILKNKAIQSPVFAAVCTLLASRDRSRFQLTTHSLHRSLALEGFHYPKVQIEEVLEFMAKNGVGRAVKNNKGATVELTDIKYTLQSIGGVAVNNQAQLVGYHNGTPKTSTKRPSIHKDAIIRRQAIKPVVVGAPKEETAKTKAYIETLINGKTVNIVLPRAMTEVELGAMLVSMHLKR